MTVKFANNASSKLASPISASDTSFTITSGEGVKFPVLGAGDTCHCTILKSDGTNEIVLVTARATDVFTATRGQEGTAAVAFNAGDRVENRITASTLGEMQTSITTLAATLASLGTTVTGMSPYLLQANFILTYKGTIASIPTGFHICDGTNGTPDLRDKFVTGAGAAYAVDATGGSKDAIVVDHLHSMNFRSQDQDADHTHIVVDPGHFHQEIMVQKGAFGAGGGAGSLVNYETPQSSSFNTNPATTGITLSGQTANHGHTVIGNTASVGASGTNANLPPYYALAFIMKL